MAILRIPPMKKIPEGATLEDRERMYDEHIAELKRLNPKRYNADGSLKSIKIPVAGIVAAIISTVFFVVLTVLSR